MFDNTAGALVGATDDVNRQVDVDGFHANLDVGPQYGEEEWLEDGENNVVNVEPDLEQEYFDWGWFGGY